MKLDPVRLARQERCFEAWRNGKEINGIHKYAIGIIEAITGFGKTFIAILAIKYMNKHHPDRDAIVIVPKIKLAEDWKGYWDLDEQTKKKTWIPGHIEIHGLTNVQVFVVNTFVLYKDWKTDLLILDECHRYANEDSQYFSTVLGITKYRFLLAMSATLAKKEKDFFARFNIPVVDTVDEAEGQKFGYVAPAAIYNLGIKLSPEDEKFNKEINDKFKYYFGRFNNEFELVMACNGKKDVPQRVRLKDGKDLGKRTPKEWVKQWARVNNYNGLPTHPYSPSNISRNAAQCMAVMHERKNVWQNFPSKLELAAKIIKKFPFKIIVFCETSAFADKLANILPELCVAYHTNLETIGIRGTEHVIVRKKDKAHKQQLIEEGYTILGNTKRKAIALQKFLNPKGTVRALITVRAVDEGVDIPSVSMTLQCAYSSKPRQGTQRRGRSGRVDYDNLSKKALNVYMYMAGTQEEKWLRDSQIGKIAIDVTSIEQINPTQVIALGNMGDGEIIIEESDIESGVSGIDSLTRT